MRRVVAIVGLPEPSPTSADGDETIATAVIG
jgi:hypothetical protein